MNNNAKVAESRTYSSIQEHERQEAEQHDKRKSYLLETRDFFQHKAIQFPVYSWKVMMYVLYNNFPKDSFSSEQNVKGREYEKKKFITKCKQQT